MDWHTHFEQIFFTAWQKAGLPHHQDFRIDDNEMKEYGNFNEEWRINATNLPPGLQAYQLQSVYGFGVMVGLMFSRMLKLDNAQTKLVTHWCGRFNLGISLFDYICDELEGVNSIASLQVFQPFINKTYSDKHVLTAAQTLLSNLAGSVLHDLRKSAGEKTGNHKADRLFKRMKRLFEAQTFISKEKGFSETDFKKLNKALFLKSAAPFRIMAEYTARMAGADDLLLIKRARSLGKAIGYCYWIIDDAKDVWADLEAGQWNLFLQLAAEEDPQIFAIDRDTLTNSLLLNIWENSHHVQKISRQVIKRLVKATHKLQVSEKVKKDNLGFVSASLWQWYNY